jgi:hypothetical protein
MQEALAKSANWDDIDARVFVKFCQFAYTGDYTPPNPDIEENSNHDIEKNSNLIRKRSLVTPEPPPEEAEEDIWSRFGSTKKAKIKKRATEIEGESKIAKLRKAFESKRYHGIQDNLKNDCRPVANESAEEDFTPVFLGHAQLYVLADKHGIKNLTSLALEKLHRTLVLFQLHECRITDILELARYTYTNTHEKDSRRLLITEYIAGEIDSIGKSTEFYSLLEDVGEFAVDFWKFTQKHLL